jgi:hypothetical protein
MAIPACVDPTACGTNVTFNTSGIKVDVELDNVGCGVDLSCSAAGVRADARVLAGGGILCDAGSRSLYVNRRGSTAAVDPGACYDAINIDGSGGLWTPRRGMLGGDGVGDPAFLAIPSLGDGSVKTFALAGNSFAVPAGGCPERWQGHCVAKINLTANTFPQGSWATINFSLDIAGITHAVQNTRITVAMSETASGRIKANQWVWIPFIADGDPGQVGTFNLRANLIDRFNVSGTFDADNCMEFEGIQFTRFVR